VPALAEAAWLLPVLLVLGLAGGLFHWRPQFDLTILKLALVALVAPALGEELLFRAALLPQPDPDAPLPMKPLAASIVLFVAWHPLQLLVFDANWARTVLDPWFLASVAALGLASARLYWKTGSIWPSVALHWLVVVAWKALLGGPSPWITR
jgi:predicted Abi (CAAX) family protease